MFLVFLILFLLLYLRMINPTLKPGIFKLFRYIDTDFIATWRLMTPTALFAEGFLDLVTIYSTYDLYDDKNKK